MSTILYTVSTQCSSASSKSWSCRKDTTISQTKPTTESNVINIGADKNRKCLINSNFGFQHADSAKYLSSPTRFWCPHVPLFRFPALSFCCCKRLYKTKSIQYDKQKFSTRLKFILSFHKKRKFLLKDVALTVQEESCICLENKDIPRTTRFTSLQCLLDIPWPWPGWPPVWENTHFHLCLFIPLFLCWGYQHWCCLQQ